MWQVSFTPSEVEWKHWKWICNWKKTVRPFRCSHSQRLRSKSSPLMLSRRVQKGHSHGGPCYLESRGGTLPEKALASTLAEFWPINCILHRNCSQNQTAVHHRQKSLMGKKQCFLLDAAAVFLWDTERGRERAGEKRKYNTYHLSLLFYLSLPALKTASPLTENKRPTTDENKGREGTGGGCKEIKNMSPLL